MDDPNVFANLTPADGIRGTYAAEAFRHPHNASRYINSAGRVAALPVVGIVETPRLIHFRPRCRSRSPPVPSC